jgi:ligand-binding sensor domain-containing protein
MQRILNFLACFFICANCFAQQYPFVHYTPKDGLISNMIKGIYQDSKGRLYFNSVHGLSVYDGSSFTNYNSKNGLGFDIVNCVMEMGIDSLWIVTNSSKINCLVNGKMKLLPLHNEGNIINNLCKDEKGDIYAAAEEGLLIFDRKDRFVQLPFVNMKGENVSSYILYAFSVGDYLIVQRDGSLLPEEDNVLYLYSKTSKTITSEMAGIYGVQIALDGRIWASTEQGVMAIDANEIQKGKIVLQDLPEQYAALRNKKRYFILFDNGNNCWLGDQNSIFLKVSPEGAITTFTSVSGLSMFYINSVFRDREGITWIATNNDGVSKLVHNNFSHIENPFDLVQPSVISYNQTTDNMIVYSASNATAAIIHENKKNYFGFKDQKAVKDLVETPYGFFAIRSNTIYKLKNRNKIFYAETAFTGSVQNFMSNSLVDKNGNR